MMLKTMKSMVFSAAAAGLLFASGSLVASESDDKIESSFQKTYVYKTYLKDDSVKIASKDGVVTLTGTVSEDSRKGLAKETAASLPGVVRVDNQLATKAEVATENADIWIARKVKLNLFFHRNVSYSDTTVEVKEGVVTLTGKTGSQAQKDLTTEYTKDIDGVKEVKNEMTVTEAAKPVERTAEEKIDDASVTAQVRTALSSRRSTNALTIKIETRDGEVTLTGIAKNAAEKALVTKVVSDLRGVTSVKNQMTVEEPKTK